MKECYGYMGRILFVDLNEHRIWEERLDEDVRRKFLGGWGIGCYFIYKQMKPHSDPLGPENILAVGSGPFTLSGVFSTSRVHVMAKSPLTNYWGASNCGGTFGNALKRSGFDLVFIKGKASSPVYLLIIEGKAEIRDASSLWGLDTVSTEAKLKKEHGHRASVLCIGPAGEKLSRIAAIVNDGGRVAARSGLGAVMGSKKLKAIVCKGSNKPLVYAPDEVRCLMREVKRKTVTEPSPMFTVLRQSGTSGVLVGALATQDAPIKNWMGTNVTDFPEDKWAKISWDSIKPYEIKKYACEGCPIACGGLLNTKWGIVHKPEYETLAAFGPMCLIDDIQTIIYANDICNRYGLDTISTGATIAFAIECFEKGIINVKDTDGIELRWGNADAVVKLLDKMAKREGIGDLLADGAKWGAEKISRDAVNIAMHVGGEMLPMHDPRFAPGWGAIYVCDPTPARHTRGGTPFIEKGMLSKDATLIREFDIPASLDPYDPQRGYWHMVMSARQYVIECSGLCLFAADAIYLPFIELLRAITGWEINAKELLDIGRRILTLLHMFNFREGFRPSQFRLPDRVCGYPPLREGPLRGISIDIEQLRKAYYEAVGLDVKTGEVSKEIRKELGLDEL